MNAKRLNYYRQAATAVMEELGSSPDGLSAKEATHRLEQFGANLLHKTKHEPAIATFGRQFKNLLVVMLLVSAGLSIFLKDGKTAVILLLIALLNAFVGYFQEHKAETLMKSLEQLLVPKAKVVRGGAVQEIDSTELVVGDVVYIEEGDSAPADLRILSEQELSTNDFALTGESNPSRKFVHAISADVPLGNRHNLVFMGTTIATGSARGIVVSTGMQTELGRIAALSQTTHNEPSPLQQEMNHLATRLAQGTIILAFVLGGIALKSDLGLHAAILFGVGISAAMIPTGLVAEVNITLAQTASRMAKQRALVKKLSAVETLGATNYILTDKTGTLTTNEMTVQNVLIGKDLYGVSGSGYEANGTILQPNGKALTAAALKKMELFFTAAYLASNAHVHPPDDQHPNWYVVGDPTEGALITLARKAGLDLSATDEAYTEEREFQFDSARKLLSSVRSHGKQTIVFVKGAPENLLAQSTDIWDHGHVRPLTAADRAFYTNYNNKQAEAAMRNLGFGYRIITAKSEYTMHAVEQKFVFMGIASMVDPLRSAVPAAMLAARRAHVKVSVITGDYPATALAVAQKANLSDEVTIVLGADLAGLADSQILALVERGGAVFSRVAPEDKLRIVEIVKRSGHVVAVTGDGINDAPALRRADIGVAMGRTGTDVAKDAAEIVLLDDSFDTLVKAIEQGRLTYQNIKKAARCVLTANAAELITVFIGLSATAALHVAPAITAIQILAIDVVAQILPVTALGWDAAQGKLMREQPRKLSDHIISPGAIGGFVGFGLLAALLSYGNYLLYFARGHLSPRYLDPSLPQYHSATSLTYLTLVLCLYVYLMFERSDSHERFFSSYLYSNRKLLGALALSLFLVANLIYNPLVQPYFSTGSLSLTDWFFALAAATIYLGMRLLQRHTRKHTRHAVLSLHHQIHP